MNEDKASRYHRLRRRAALGSMLAQAAVLVLLLSTHASSRIASFAQVGAARVGVPALLGPVLQVTLVVIAAGLLTALASFPFDLYSGFALERRYGLTAERGRAWLLLHAKAGGLGLILALLASVAVNALLRLWPAWWWVPASAGGAAAIVGLFVVWPVIILPLFDPIEPLEQGTLAASLSDLARRAGAGPVRLFSWRTGARSRKGQAVLAGLGATRRVLLSDTLLERYRDEEIEVVLAHELGHEAKGDAWAAIVLEVAVMTASLAACDWALDFWAGSPGFGARDDPAALPLLALVGGACRAVAGPVLNAVSRAFERRANRFALDLTGNPAAFISAIRRLSEQNLADPAPSRLVRALWLTHPPISERLAAAEAWRA